MLLALFCHSDSMPFHDKVSKAVSQCLLQLLFCTSFTIFFAFTTTTVQSAVPIQSRESELRGFFISRGGGYFSYCQLMIATAARKKECFRKSDMLFAKCVGIFIKLDSILAPAQEVASKGRARGKFTRWRPFYKSIET